MQQQHRNAEIDGNAEDRDGILEIHQAQLDARPEPQLAPEGDRDGEARPERLANMQPPNRLRTYFPVSLFIAIVAIGLAFPASYSVWNLASLRWPQSNSTQVTETSSTNQMSPISQNSTQTIPTSETITTTQTVYATQTIKEEAIPTSESIEYAVPHFQEFMNTQNGVVSLMDSVSSTIPFAYELQIMETVTHDLGSVVEGSNLPFEDELVSCLKQTEILADEASPMVRDIFPHAEQVVLGFLTSHRSIDKFLSKIEKHENFPTLGSRVSKSTKLIEKDMSELFGNAMQELENALAGLMVDVGEASAKVRKLGMQVSKCSRIAERNNKQTKAEMTEYSNSLAALWGRLIGEDARIDNFEYHFGILSKVQEFHDDANKSLGLIKLNIEGLRTRVKFFRHQSARVALKEIAAALSDHKEIVNEGIRMLERKQREMKSQEKKALDRIRTGFYRRRY